MAPVKRKADGKDAASNRKADQTPPAKRQRKEGAAHGPAKDQAKTVPASTLLKDEGRAFPRGGQGALSQLEQKQIQVQATKDALFEEAGHKSLKDVDITDEEDLGDAPEQATKSAKRKKKAKAQKQADKSDEPRFRVEGLKAKYLQPGCTVLGQVSRISAQEILLDLPNNLTGTVSIASVSSQMLSRIQDLVKEDEDEQDDGEADIDLSKIFYPGQYLRAAPANDVEDTAAKLRKRIELSLDPRRVNGKQDAKSITVASTVQASVLSVEDHGLIMDLGLDDTTIKGFMSSKEIPGQLQYSDLKEGSVFLCMVTGLSSNGKVIKLSANHQKVGDTRKSNVLTESPTVDSLLPGTAVEVLISTVEASTFSGIVMGSVNTGADAIHSGAATTGGDLSKKYKVGSKVKARIIFAMTSEETTRLGVSVLEHVLDLSSRQAGEKSKPKRPLDTLVRSAVVEAAKIISVEPSLGTFVDVGVKGVQGFVHISRLSDGRVDTLEKTTGPFKVSSAHRARVLDYNAFDALFLLSFQQSILSQPFLRYEDVPVGDLVQAKVEKVVLKGGIVLELAQGVTGFVTETHVSDIKLSDPGKKFKQGATVRARVLSVDAERRRIALSLKKSLGVDDFAPWTSYLQIEVGSSSVGTVLKVLDVGVVLQFFGRIRGFLPKSELGDTFVDNPASRFPIGSTVRVKALAVQPEEEKLIVSARSALGADEQMQEAYAALKLGDIVSGVITAKTDDTLTVDLKGSDIRATLRKGHLTDQSVTKTASTFKKLRLGQAMNELVVIEKFDKKHSVVISNKPRLLAQAKEESLPTELSDLAVGQDVSCYVRQVTPTGIFVQIPGGVVGLLPVTQIPDEQRKLANFGLSKDSTVLARVIHIDKEQNRFALSAKPETDKPKAPKDKAGGVGSQIINPVDEKSTSMADYIPGYISKARVMAIKDTQLNVELADGLKGRIDVSEMFTSLDQINDRKRPLKSIKPKQVIDVRVLGVHDSRNHRFLPISHPAGKGATFELSAKLEAKDHSVLLEELKVGSSYLGFVNNIAESALWVHLSPNLRGRVQLLDISDKPAVLQNLEAHYPIGAAVTAYVKSVDPSNNRLDLSFKTTDEGPLKLEDLHVGMSLAGRVTKTTERSVLVQLSPSLSGSLSLLDLADDLEKADPTAFKKNSVVRVSVVAVDRPNKRVTLSTRPSKVLSSALPVKDKLITKLNQLKAGDIVRGFVKNVADVGLFVTLGHGVTGYVRVTDLSDSFLKEWKTHFEVDRLVRGKVIAIDETSGNIQLSLKDSVISGDYKAPLTFKDFKKGQIVTGKIRKIEDYGAFIVIDKSQNVSGLCHKTEIADRDIDNVKDILSEDDVVKAKILKIETEKKRISFGLKPSYFDAEVVDSDDEDIEVESDESEDSLEPGLETEEGLDSDLEDEDGGADESDDPGSEPDQMDTDDESDGGIELDLQDLQSLAQQSRKASKRELAENDEGLDAGGFNWDGDVVMGDDDVVVAPTDAEPSEPKKKRRKPEIKIDETGNLDDNGPRSKDDYERLLLSERDNSELWMRYMGFHLDLGETEEARALAERALRNIHIREQDEKFNIWVALFNLESAYGSEESLDEVFKRACQYNDKDKLHDALVGIHIQNNDLKKADDLYETMAGNKGFRAKPEFWEHYATFLFDKRREPGRARALLERGLKSVLPLSALQLTKSFALLEFKRETGDPERGRTIFEGLFNTYPKKWDLWNILIDVEKNEMAKGRGAKENVSQLYDRLTAPEKTKTMKPSTAKSIFKQWLSWEETHGKKKEAERVKARAAAYVGSRNGTIE